VADYWEWRKEIVTRLETTRQRLTALTQQSDRLSKTAQAMAQLGQSRYSSTRTTAFWLDFRGSESSLRQSERRLALLGYDTEIALSRAHFRRLVEKSGFKKDVLDKLKGDSGLSADVDLVFDDDAPCANGVKLNPDRIGVVISLNAPDRQYKVLTEVALHYSLEGIQFLPTRSAEICQSGNPNWPEYLEIMRRVNGFLWDSANWPVRPVQMISPPLGSWSPYMEIVGANISLLSKSTAGRHQLFAMSPIPALPAGSDIAVSVGRQPITAKLDAELKELAKPLNYDYASGEFVRTGGPVFDQANQSINLSIYIHAKLEGGSNPFEWTIDSHAGVQVRCKVAARGSTLYLLLNDITIDPNSFAANGHWKQTGLQMDIDQYAGDLKKFITAPRSPIEFPLPLRSAAQPRILEERLVVYLAE